MPEDDKYDVLEKIGALPALPPHATTCREDEEDEDHANTDTAL